MDNLRDRCCWRGCAVESDMTYYGIGLCDGHYEQACTVYLPTYQYTVDRVIPEAAAEMQQNHQTQTKDAK